MYFLWYVPTQYDIVTPQMQWTIALLYCGKAYDTRLASILQPSQDGQRHTAHIAHQSLNCQCTVHNTHCPVHNAQCTMSGVQCSVLMPMQSASKVHSLKAVPSSQCTVPWQGTFRQYIVVQCNQCSAVECNECKAYYWLHTLISQLTIISWQDTLPRQLTHCLL